MGLIRIPSPDEVLERAPSLHLAVCESIGGAVQDAYRVFRTEKRPFEPNTHASWVREGIRERLDAHGQEAEFDREELPFCGLHLHHSLGEFKILKSDHGTVPVPRSKTRLQFYNANARGPWQLRLWTPEASAHEQGGEEVAELEVPLNYVYHWQLGLEGVLDSIILSLLLNATRWRVRCHWDHVLPHPATLIDSQPASAPAESHTRDIPGIRLRNHKPTGTEQDE